MPSVSPDFVTVGDSNYSHALRCSATTIERIYPESTLYVYDWGIDEETVNDLSARNNTVVVDWQRNCRYEVNGLDKVQLSIEELLEGNLYLNHIVTSIGGLEYGEMVKRKDFFMRQIPQCIKDCAERASSPLVYIDGDAILINDIDEVFDDEFDVAGTLEPYVETQMYDRRGTVYVLNAGVILFDTPTSKIRAFCDLWTEQILDLPMTGIRLQTALSVLFQRSNTEIFETYYSTGQLTTPGGDFTTLVVPSEFYNYSWMDIGVDPGEQKILHFKSGKLNDDIFRSMIADIEQDRLAVWSRKRGGRETE